MDHTPITVDYMPEGEDWTVTVRYGQLEEAATAPGLIAARDQADQILERIAPGTPSRAVHLLDGDAFAFTTAYLHARHGLTPVAEAPTQPDGEEVEEAEEQGAQAATNTG
ncbi:hypothetical protein N8J89_05740 [Crossiella sp. CA-258035]|uniref:hypothetical protein n=1 Tax=Crossiella sp. CA-258035 TaxID=2981138 RepID=UPI0024BCA0F5|nr:hypothetical protein [Crossiella sp. CA-258035]WHT20569.1 hypothetical protein N8J89_05740 [Crossiella sp. CA-258035]